MLDPDTFMAVFYTFIGAFFAARIWTNRRRSRHLVRPSVARWSGLNQYALRPGTRGFLPAQGSGGLAATPFIVESIKPSFAEVEALETRWEDDIWGIEGHLDPAPGKIDPMSTMLYGDEPAPGKIDPMSTMLYGD